jgi:hypothetical protein
MSYLCIRKSRWFSIFSGRKSNLLILTFNLSFGHNLCLKRPNGSCESILNIYVLKTFQWYKELLNSMSFDPYNRSLKIWESIKTPTLKVRAHLGVWGFIPLHFATLLGGWNVIFGLHTWPAPSLALALVANPRLGLQHMKDDDSSQKKESKAC